MTIESSTGHRGIRFPLAHLARCKPPCSSRCRLAAIDALRRTKRVGAGMKFFDRPYLLLTLTTLFWAGNAIAGKLAAGVIPPFTLTFVRWTTGHR
jgi:hypothetical protein